MPQVSIEAPLSQEVVRPRGQSRDSDPKSPQVVLR